MGFSGDGYAQVFSIAEAVYLYRAHMLAVNREDMVRKLDYNLPRFVRALCRGAVPDRVISGMYDLPLEKEFEDCKLDVGSDPSTWMEFEGLPRTMQLSEADTQSTVSVAEQTMQKLKPGGNVKEKPGEGIELAEGILHKIESLLGNVVPKNGAYVACAVVGNRHFDDFDVGNAFLARGTLHNVMEALLIGVSYSRLSADKSGDRDSIRFRRRVFDAYLPVMIARICNDNLTPVECFEQMWDGRLRPLSDRGKRTSKTNRRK